MYLEIKKPYFSSNKRKKQGKRAIADLLKKQKKYHFAIHLFPTLRERIVYGETKKSIRHRMPI
jgi:hypothetical protein